MSSLSLASALLVGIARLSQEQLLEVFFFGVNAGPCSALVVLPMRAGAWLSVARKRWTAWAAAHHGRAPLALL